MTQLSGERPTKCNLGGLSKARPLCNCALGVCQRRRLMLRPRFDIDPIYHFLVWTFSAFFLLSTAFKTSGAFPNFWYFVGSVIALLPLLLAAMSTLRSGLSAHRGMRRFSNGFPTVGLPRRHGNTMPVLLFFTDVGDGPDQASWDMVLGVFAMSALYLKLCNTSDGYWPLESIFALGAFETRQVSLLSLVKRHCYRLCALKARHKKRNH